MTPDEECSEEELDRRCELFAQAMFGRSFEEVEEADWHDWLLEWAWVRTPEGQQLLQELKAKQEQRGAPITNIEFREAVEALELQLARQAQRP